jgi:hypothetical protein
MGLNACLNALVFVKLCIGERSVVVFARTQRSDITEREMIILGRGELIINVTPFALCRVRSPAEASGVSIHTTATRSRVEHNIS